MRKKSVMKKGFLLGLLVSFSLCLYCEENSTDRLQQIQKVEKEIDSFVDLRNYYEERVARLRHKAERYRLQKKHLAEGRQLCKEADVAERVVKQIDGELERLQKERQTLLNS